MLLFYTGLNVDFRGFRAYFKESLLITITNVSVTIALVALVLITLNYSLLTSLIVAIALSNTATEVAVLVLNEARIGSYLFRNVVLSASFYDDILAVVLISIIREGILVGGYALLGIAKLVLAISITLIIAKLLLSIVQEHVYRLIISWSQLLLIAAITFFLLSYIFEIEGIGATLGAYLAGVVISMLRLIHDPTLTYVTRVEELITRVGTVLDFFLIPLFFVYVGIRADVAKLISLTSIILLIVAFMGKFLGTLAPTLLLSKRKIRQSILMGVLMNVRGSLEPALMLIALEKGILDLTLFNAVIFVSITTSIVSPVIFSNLVKKWYHELL